MQMLRHDKLSLTTTSSWQDIDLHIVLNLAEQASNSLELSIELWRVDVKNRFCVGSTVYSFDEFCCILRHAGEWQEFSNNSKSSGLKIKFSGEVITAGTSDIKEFTNLLSNVDDDVIEGSEKQLQIEQQNIAMIQCELGVLEARDLNIHEENFSEVFCILYLNGLEFARTSVLVPGQSLQWKEEFFIIDLPQEQESLKSCALSLKFGALVLLVKEYFWAVF